MNWDDSYAVEDAHFHSSPWESESEMFEDTTT